MKISEITEESFQSYIETETVSTARPLSSSDVKLSQLIRDHYNKNRELHQNALKIDPKEVTTEAKDNLYSARYDSLTGLTDSRFMVLLLEKSLLIAKQENKVLAILYLQLNGLKNVVSMYGNAISDEILIIVAQRLKLGIGRKDHLAHLYGNKYLIGLMMNKNNLRIVESTSKKITELISKPINIEKHRIVLSVKICSVAYPMHGDKIRTLFYIAKMKMAKLIQGT